MNAPAGYQLAARPTNYQGTLMRSRLEAKVAAAFDAAGIPWEYEPHALADGDDQWLPDFRVGTANGSRAYVEVRPTLELLTGDLARYTRIAAACDPAATVVGIGFDDADPLAAVTVDGHRLIRLRLGTPRRVERNGVATVAPMPKMSLLPVPAALRRRAGEVNRLAKLTRDLRVFRTPDGRGFARNSALALPLLRVDYHGEPTVADVVAAAYHDVYGRPPSQEKVAEHLADLTVRCTVVEAVCQGSARVSDDRFLVDLGANYEQGRVVTITPTGWRLATQSPLPLYRDGVSALPLPVPGGHVDELFDLLNVHEDDFEVFVDHLAGHYLAGRKQPKLTKQGDPWTGIRYRHDHSPTYANPLGQVLSLVRTRESSCFSHADNLVVIRFSSLQGNDRESAFRAEQAIQAMSGRLVGALLDRAVSILAGPRELGPPTQLALPTDASGADDAE